MNHPYLMIAGVAILGFILPEVLAAFGKVRVPLAMNIYSGIGCALICAAIVL
ncbi:MAG: hypothetical protein ACRCTX_14310 [Afipia sp.]